jgi:hypothetical protein
MLLVYNLFRSPRRDSASTADVILHLFTREEGAAREPLMGSLTGAMADSVHVMGRVVLVMACHAPFSFSYLLLIL